MNQPSISDYALIGDTRSAALCSLAGSIDWLCLPRFDSEPVFGRLVGGERAGCFEITPTDPYSASRAYRPGSAVLDTKWETSTGRAVLTDAMILEVSGTLLPQALLVRTVRCMSGSVSLRILFDPRRSLKGLPPRSEKRHGALICSWGSLAIGLSTTPEMVLEPGRELEVQLDSDEEITFHLALADRSPVVLLSSETAGRHLARTTSWWRQWSSELLYHGPFRDAVQRSLITLRLLTYSPSGAPVAAPTTSLPEVLGGGRNWDYRFSWPRDASIGVAAFLAAGKQEEAHSFMHWLTHASRLTHPRMDVLYTVHGKPGPAEREVSEASGYRGSRPVRVGNAASEQHQLDVYGWVVDAAWLMTQSGQKLGREAWRALRAFADYVARSWRLPDAGIWEVRGEPAHHVHSKLMGWLALDRAVKMATSQGARPSQLRVWREQAELLAADIKSKGFNTEMNSYVWSYGSRHLDAALLLLPMLEFEEQGSRRIEGTVSAIQDQLSARRGLIYRYPPGADLMEGDEGAFLPCSFWLVQALARQGELDQATALFDQLLTFANDLGLFSEEINPLTGELLGNFPQALTHAALVQAAIAIDKASDESRSTTDLLERN